LVFGLNAAISLEFGFMLNIFHSEMKINIKIMKTKCGIITTHTLALVGSEWLASHPSHSTTTLTV
jgi:hypothetical protein